MKWFQRAVSQDHLDTAARCLLAWYLVAQTIALTGRGFEWHGETDWSSGLSIILSCGVVVSMGIVFWSTFMMWFYLVRYWNRALRGYSLFIQATLLVAIAFIPWGTLAVYYLGYKPRMRQMSTRG